MTKAARVLNSERQTDQWKEKRVLTEKEEGERERKNKQKKTVFMSKKKRFTVGFHLRQSA